MTKEPSLSVRAVCFDLGGVVIRICRGWDEGCAAAGLPVRTGVDWSAADPLIERLQSGALDTIAFAHRLAALWGGAYSATNILAIHEAWLREEYEGVGELIDGVAAAGKTTAVLSNTNDSHWPRLLRLPALRRIPHLFASHQLGVAKPAPRAFEAVERGLGLAGGDIAFFDDTPENVEAAAHRGWRAALVDPLRPTAPQMRSALLALGVELRASGAPPSQRR